MRRAMSSAQIASLYDAHAPALFRFLMALTGHEADTRDLLQELFLRVARRPASEVLRDPAAWLFRAARNLSIDRARRRDARNRAMTRMANEPAIHSSVSENGDEAQHRHAAAVLASLPEEQRAVVHLKSGKTSPSPASLRCWTSPPTPPPAATATPWRNCAPFSPTRA